jgi:hypothetical protein
VAADHRGLPARTRLPITRRTSSLPDLPRVLADAVVALHAMPVAARAGDRRDAAHGGDGHDPLRRPRGEGVDERAACCTPRSTSGRAASAPFQPLRPTALPCRHEQERKVLVTPWSTSFANVSRISTSGCS